MQYGAPVFIIWQTLPSGKRKGRIITNIRGLNRMVWTNLYPMPLQRNVIAIVAGARYISVVDAAAFFYQFWVAMQDRQKLTVISHWRQEYFNVTPMDYWKLAAYAQRQIDIIQQRHKTYVKAYINNIVIFSTLLDEHLRHLRVVF